VDQAVTFWRLGKAHRQSPAAALTHAKRQPGSDVLLRSPSFEACAAGRNLLSLILPLFSRIGATPLLFSAQSFAALLRPFCWPPAEMFSDIRRFTELDTNVFDTPSTSVEWPDYTGSFTVEYTAFEDSNDVDAPMEFTVNTQ